MKLYESEGKGLLDRSGISVPRGKVVASAEEAAGLTKQYGSVMAKAQVLWGRRARAHGVIPCANEEQLAAAVGSLIGGEMFGERIERVLVEEKLDVAQEAYLAALSSIFLRQSKPKMKTLQRRDSSCQRSGS